MIQPNDLDFKKASHILNVILQILDEATLSSIVTETGQIAFSTTDGRIYIKSGGVLKSVAFSEDVENVGVYYQTEDPRLVDGLLTTFSSPALWYESSSTTLKIYNVDADAWTTITSDSETTSTVAVYVDGDEYPNNSVVTHSNKLYQNQNGFDITDSVWTDSSWTNIGNTVDSANLRTNTYSIPSTLVDGNTLASVTRSGNDYNIEHLYDNSYPTVFILDSSLLQVGVETMFVDENNIQISFAEEIDENFIVVIKD